MSRDSPQGPAAHPRRPHTGRRRNPAVRQAVLDATADLLTDSANTAIGVDAIARAAGVSKHTIYRWWPTKGAVLLEAMVERARQEAPAPDTGTLATDLDLFLTATMRTVDDAATLLRTVLAEALRDPATAEMLRTFTAARRRELHAVLARGQARDELAPDADLDLMVEQVYGVLWYRLLFGHAPLTSEVATRLTRALLPRP